jgi:hypothetical protein
MADLTVTYLVAVGALASVIWLRTRRGCWLAIAVAVLAAATLTKSEGQIFAALLVLTVLVAGVARHRVAALPAAFLLLAPLVFVPWRLWLGHHGLPTSMADFRVGDVLHPRFFSGRSYRLTYALREMRRTGVREFAQAVGGWHTIGFGGWILAIPWLGGLVLAARRVPLAATTAVMWFALAFFGLATTYWIARPNVYYYMNVTVRRVEPTLIAAAIVLLALLVGLSLAPAQSASSTSSVRFPISALVPAPMRHRVVVFVAPLAAVVVAGFVADLRPNVLRVGPIDVAALERELSAQLENELLAQTYAYRVYARCTPTSPDGLNYACLLETTGRVGVPPKHSPGTRRSVASPARLTSSGACQATATRCTDLKRALEYPRLVDNPGGRARVGGVAAVAAELGDVGGDRCGRA